MVGNSVTLFLKGLWILVTKMWQEEGLSFRQKSVTSFVNFLGSKQERKISSEIFHIHDILKQNYRLSMPPNCKSTTFKKSRDEIHFRSFAKWVLAKYTLKTSKLSGLRPTHVTLLFILYLISSTTERRPWNFLLTRAALDDERIRNAFSPSLFTLHPGNCVAHRWDFLFHFLKSK